MSVKSLIFLFFVQFTNSSLIFSTDSFLFSTKLEDGKSIEDKLLQHADHFDFSNISPSSKLYSMEHKNELNRQVKYDLKNQRQIILISQHARPTSLKLPLNFIG